MDDLEKNLIEVWFNGLQLLIIFISAIWAFFRFRIENPYRPRIEFDVECKFLGPQYNTYVACITVNAVNKGNVEHSFKEIRLRVRGIKNNETLSEFKDHPKRLNFPHEIMKINIVPPKFRYFFVRPGVNQAFSFATQIPAEVGFIVIRASFKYKSKKNDLHTAEKVFEVKNEIRGHG